MRSVLARRQHQLRLSLCSRVWSSSEARICAVTSGLTSCTPPYSCGQTEDERRFEDGHHPAATEPGTRPPNVNGGLADVTHHFELETLIDAGDCFAAIGNYHGVYRQTGRGLDARVGHVWRIKGGLVQSFEQFTDTLLVAQAMR